MAVPFCKIAGRHGWLKVRYMCVCLGGWIKWSKEHFTNRLLVFAFSCVALGNLLASLVLIQKRSLDKLFSVLPSNSKMLLFG